MTAAELLLDLTERLTEADARLTMMAHKERFRGDLHNYYSGKAEGVRLALGYVNELRRFAGGDQ